ncbi:hypothetical protein KUTeg_004200 [Tegillarca granosa]|uniref:Dehydrogenase/reductase SDR family protein 7-like n=1 Tax=Tegillarca granosa TaxID=220873 RepID=A0ABQ9FPA5_TEGGR|nr:hypothetical protein KUTeg_004200 [Tegillarca granosa]
MLSVMKIEPTEIDKFLVVIILLQQPIKIPNICITSSQIKQNLPLGKDEQFHRQGTALHLQEAGGRCVDQQGKNHVAPGTITTKINTIETGMKSSTIVEREMINWMCNLHWSTVCSFIGAPVGLACILYVLLSHKKKKDVRGKVVLITGATSGLGEVILAGRNKEKLQQVKDSLQQQKVDNAYCPGVIQLDLEKIQTLPEKVEEAVKIFGQIDILINNAGISYRGVVADTQLDVDVKLMTVNYFAQVALTKAVLSKMLTQGSGCIIGISSVQGKIAIPYRSAYAASKHAFQAFYDTLRAEIAEDNINVIVISPGYIKTNLSHNAPWTKQQNRAWIQFTVAEQILSAIIWQKD